MSDFGDAEPEDAWHPDDPMLLLIDNLLQRLDLLDHRPPSTGRLADLLEVVARRLEPWEVLRGSLDARTEVRVQQLIDDLAFLRRRNG